MEGQEKFENEWRELLDGQEITPPDTVWTAIDRKLVYAELSIYKSKALFYKWAVAAVVFIAASIGVYQFWYFQGNTNGFTQVSSIVIDMPQQLSGYVWGMLPERTIDGKSIVAIVDEEGKNASAKTSKSQINQPLHIAELPIEDRQMLGLILPAYHKIQPSLDQENVLDFEIPEKLVWIDFTKLAVQSKEGKNQNQYFAGLNYGAGSFDPNFRSTGTSLLSDNLDVNPAAFSLTDNEAADVNAPSVREGMLPGESMTFGMNVGYNLSDRWVLESGLQYSKSAATTETNVVIQTSRWQESIPATAQVRGNAQLESVVKREEILEYDTGAISLNNEFQFTSLPFKAGYKIYDSRFRMEINAGVVANFYLGNRLSGKEGEIAQITIGPGQESPYRSLTVAGLAGVKFGYRLFKNFDVTLEPNYRQSLNDLTKQDVEFKTSPSGFGVLTGLRYNFN